ncbi:MAG: response regulator [Thiohalobacterales bacterium]|nr:response regulator [Thiohalobacterales bacterium]
MKTVLIVDDEPHVIRIMRLALEKSGYRVDEAANGLQALEYLAKNSPDVMISDIDMPRMNGRELCEEMVRILPGRTFPVFVLTARAEHEHREWSAAIDNLGFMEKPVSIRRLLSALDDYFAKQTLSGERKCQSVR